MSHPPTVRRFRIVPIIIFVGVPTLIIVVGLISVAVSPKSLRPSQSATPAASSPFNRAEFSAYWSGILSDDTRSLVTSVDWLDGVLTAHTKLFADSDAVVPALIICRALSFYWTQAGQEFHPVRVLDGADQILTSRYWTEGACEWRR